MAYSWTRNNGSDPISGGLGGVFLGAATPGTTIRRVILGWSVIVVAPMWSFERLIGQPVFAGITTKRASAGASLPDPSVSPLPEISYPLERWLWWEMCDLSAASSTTYTDPDGPVSLRTDRTAAARDEECAVKNTLVGDNLNVWLSIGCPALANVSLIGTVFGYASVLVSS